MSAQHEVVTRDQPGVYPDMPMEQYLALPAVSAGLIKAILNECPRAAWARSWLNQDRLIDFSGASDRGTIAHALLLDGDSSKMAVIDPMDHPAEKTGVIPDGWTNKSIRTARDAARASGKIPVLSKDATAIEDMVGEALAYLESVKDEEPAIWDTFAGDGRGASEETLVWVESAIPCRMRPDRRNADWSVIVDYKTTARSVEPDSWGRTQLIGMGYYLSAAWYRRGCEKHFGTQPDYVFLAQEDEPPYLCSLIGVNPQMLAAGAAMIERGLASWKRCIDQGHWPAYPTRVCYPDAPAYMMAKWEEEQLNDVEKHWAAHPVDVSSFDRPLDL